MGEVVGKGERIAQIHPFYVDGDIQHAVHPYPLSGELGGGAGQGHEAERICVHIQELRSAFCPELSRGVAGGECVPRIEKDDTVDKYLREFFQGEDCLTAIIYRPPLLRVRLYHALAPEQEFEALLDEVGGLGQAGPGGQ